MRDIGITYEIKDFSHPGFVNGRCATVIVYNKNAGFFGELHPEKISNFSLEHPIIAFEINTDILHQ